MKRVLKTSAILVAAGTLALWLATGAHRGWTKTSVAVGKIDEVSGLTYADYEQRFVAGVEILAVGLAVAWALGSLPASSADGPRGRPTPRAVNGPNRCERT